VLVYTRDKLDQIKEALVKFELKTDAKAAAMISISYVSGQVSRLVVIFPLVQIDATDITGHCCCQLLL